MSHLANRNIHNRQLTKIDWIPKQFARVLEMSVEKRSLNRKLTDTSHSLNIMDTCKSLCG